MTSASTAMPRSTPFTLIGWGAIAQALHSRLAAIPNARLDCVVVRPERVAAVRAALGSSVDVQGEVPERCRLLVECAGHSALLDHVEPALARGTECAILSIGALHEDGLAERLADTAARGGARLHLLAGAIGGIDAIAAARLAGLDEVVYTGRKPPSGWRGSPAERLLIWIHCASRRCFWRPMLARRHGFTQRTPMWQPPFPSLGWGSMPRASG